MGSLYRRRIDLTRFDLVAPGSGMVAAAALFRGMEPSGTGGVGHAAGLIGLSVEVSCRRQGFATFLLNEALRQFLRQGVMRVEVQTGETNAAALGLFQKLGLQERARGGVWRKDA